MGRRTARRCVLLHGFPYAPQGYDAVVPPLVAAGRRVHRALSARLWADALPARPTRRAPASRRRSASDLLDLLDALAIPRAVLARL